MEAKGSVLLQPEAERLVEEIKVYGIEDIGTAGWTRQHQNLEKLNMQAQVCVMNQADEFVVEALIDHEKVSILIHDLLVTEAWKEKVLPLVQDDLAGSHYVKLYLIMYHEAIVLGLLEKAFFTSTAVAAGGDMLVELADYCYRRTVYLNTVDPNTIEPESTKEQLKDEIMNQTDAQRVQEQKNKIDFSAGIAALTLLRFLTENASSLPVSVLSRMLNEQDVLQTVIPLMDAAPWKRTRKGKVEKYNDGKWTEVPPDDYHRLTKTEAQVWLLVNCLLLDNECRRRYEWNEQRKTNVMRLSKYFNELLIDQLPVLQDLRRLVETLTFQTPPGATDSRSIVIEQLPEIRARLMKSDWKALAAAFRERQRKQTPQELQAEMSDLASMYDMMNIEEFMEDPKCSVCGLPAEKRCSKCKMEWYCSRKCQVSAWKGHKALCETLCSLSGNVGSSVSVGAGAGGRGAADESAQIREENAKSRSKVVMIEELDD